MPQVNLPQKNRSLTHKRSDLKRFESSKKAFVTGPWSKLFYLERTLSKERRNWRQLKDNLHLLSAIER
jgi:hypothetical protein